MATAFAVFPASASSSASASGRELSIPSTPNSTLFFKNVVENSFGSRLLQSVVPSTSPQHLTRRIAATSPSSTAAKPVAFDRRLETRKGYSRWVVTVEAPSLGSCPSKREVVDYYVSVLARVLGSERDAQACLYEASSEAPFRFHCDVDQDTARVLAGLPGVLSVTPDNDNMSVGDDFIFIGQLGSNLLFPSGSAKKWLVKISKPAIGVVTKAQMVDYYAKILARVMGNEKDAQMCIYHVSWQSNFGFCCELDDECARELAGKCFTPKIPGVLSVQPDESLGSDYKDYAGNKFNGSDASLAIEEEPPIRTKKLFVTGLSFYTSEKTLRAAFEGYGELVEVKVIMDKISKRSKGYAFVEYTTEEAASAALKEMNGKIINGWMIVVDVARSNPPRNSGSRSPS
ncbi:hypothetical protein MLD38_038042 [Melastoma candidum]|uniref:Uncharacterized protein n=1 Tax=Melastoma candidum TaxID=119954 RepID=A0ACB9KY93_9MYRT|nr:hypothetical protein MLD38_038042 [Melastoma candidum]